MICGPAGTCWSRTEVFNVARDREHRVRQGGRMRWDLIGSAAAVAVPTTGCTSVSGSPDPDAQRERAARLANTAQHLQTPVREEVAVAEPAPRATTPKPKSPPRHGDLEVPEGREGGQTLTARRAGPPRPAPAAEAENGRTPCAVAPRPRPKPPSTPGSRTSPPRPRTESSHPKGSTPPSIDMAAQCRAFPDKSTCSRVSNEVARHAVESILGTGKP